MLFQADAARIPLADNSVDLIVGSPPYMDARTYGIDAQRNMGEWIEWMLAVTADAVRVSRGLVVWVCAGVTRDWCYWPGPEGLLYEWVKRGGIAWRPVYWRRVGIPGSGGKQWYRSDVEYCLAFTKDRGLLPWGDPTANGHAPKWAPGGEMSYRLTDGTRTNQWGHSADSGATVTDGDFVRSKGKRPSHRDAWGGTGHATSEEGRSANGEHKTRLSKAEKIAMGAKLHTKRDADAQSNGDPMREQAYLEPAIANPGTMPDLLTFSLDIKVGGGLMGHKLAHENEAPYPVEVPEFFIKSHCPPGGITYDPFCGSGTTLEASELCRRIGIGSDLRATKGGLKTAHQRLTRPHKPIPTKAKPMPLFPDDMVD